ncbi:MAG: response regulator transcription factor [Deltaproteobacteria bacterium]|nr:response regulator transcription factor [Deltaproteobacteria bacterium]MCB9787875.1 response regulator transcription factor [Deltaproteobacteria bacterium]
MDICVVITAEAPSESAVVRALREGGWRVVLRYPGRGTDEIAADQPDVVVVDVPVHGSVRAAVDRVIAAPGMEDIPILAVVDQDAVREAGGVRRLADFVLRPLRPGELSARARRPLAAGVRDDADRIQIGGLIIDLKGFEVSKDGAVLDLTYQEFQLLKFLASSSGQAFSRDQLLARVWGYDYYGGSRTVDIHVRRIRAKLGQPYANCLQTIRHVGYKWVSREVVPDPNE